MMQTAPRVTFRDMPPSAALEAAVRQRVATLEHRYPRITSGHVVIEAHHRRHRQGRLYHVAIHLSVPEGEVVVTRDPAQHHAHEDAQVAIRDAFDAAERRLQDHAHRLRGAVKQHEPPSLATVARLFPDHGFIRSAIDGQEIYFHRNSVLDGKFERLRPGMAVRFALHEGEGEFGPQASTVILAGKRHFVPPV